MIAEDNSIKEDDCVVRVKAQVMTRDESTGGWVPLGRGGMSVVGLRRLITSTGSDDVTTEYRLHGQRIADQSVVLNCQLKKDLQYTKANPTFHHWWTGNKRFGLTFQSSADARVLERSVCKAMETILTPPSCSGVESQIADDDVFMALNLPMGKDGSWSQSASTTSTETSSPSAPLSPSELTEGVRVTKKHTSLQRAPLLHQSTVGSSAEDDEYDSTAQVRLEGNSLQLASTSAEVSGGEVVDIEMVDYSYVKLAKTCTTPKHDYTYPIVDSPPPPPPPVRAEPSLSVESSHPSIDYMAPAVMLPARKPRRSRSATRDIFRRSTTLSSERPLVSAMRSRCVHCHEMFSHDSNHAGGCIDAPDPAQRVIDRVSCLCCARAVVYHCDVGRGGSADDWRGDDEPCTGCDPSAPGCCKRWTLLAALSLVVPCLWCYLPLNACHHCGVRWCGRCGGGRHKAA